MQPVTITLDDALMASLDRFMAARGYSNRSEAIRDLTRLGSTRRRKAKAPAATVLPRWSTCTTPPPANCRGG